MKQYAIFVSGDSYDGKRMIGKPMDWDNAIDFFEFSAGMAMGADNADITEGPTVIEGKSARLSFVGAYKGLKATYEVLPVDAE